MDQAARKYVICQKNTNLYYRLTSTGLIAFGPLVSATSYITLENAMEVWEQIQTSSKFDVIVQSVRLESEGDCRVEILLALETRLDVLKKEFEVLDQSATRDIESMSEADYQRWKILKSKIKSEVVRINKWTESFFTINS